MDLIAKIVVILSIIISSFCLNATPQQSVWYNYGDSNQVNIHLELFVSSKCPHCHKAERFLSEMEKAYPWLKVERFVINKEKSALKFFNQRLKEQGSDNFSIPAFFFCDSHWIGFASDDTTGQYLIDSIKYCRDQIIAKGELTKPTIHLLKSRGEATKFQILSAADDAPILFLLYTAIIDAISPCSFFSFLVLLAFLWIRPKERLQQFYLGLIYGLMMGFAHFLFLSELYFQLNAMLRFIAFGTGFLMLGYLYTQRQQLRRLQAMKATYQFYVLIILFALVVLIYQQTCQLNMALIFKQWEKLLAFSPLSSAKYNFLYQLFYVLTFMIFLILYLLVSRIQRFTQYLPLLKIAGWLILITVSGLLIVSPELLSNAVFSVLTLFFSLLIAKLIKLKYEQE